MIGMAQIHSLGWFKRVFEEEQFASCYQICAFSGQLTTHIWSRGATQLHLCWFSKSKSYWVLLLLKQVRLAEKYLDCQCLTWKGTKAPPIIIEVSKYFDMFEIKICVRTGSVLCVIWLWHLWSSTRNPKAGFTLSLEPIWESAESSTWEFSVWKPRQRHWHLFFFPLVMPPTFIF